MNKNEFCEKKDNGFDMVCIRLGCFLIREELRKGLASSWTSLEVELVLSVPFQYQN